MSEDGPLARLAVALASDLGTDVFLRSPMPWKCPACQMPIRHSDDEAAPRPGVRYRCHVCRLELVLDRETDKLTEAPSRTDRDTPPPKLPSDA